ncbi:MAG: hypothetical protein ACK4TA_11510 [Saprospiraceae bacterium]
MVLIGKSKLGYAQSKIISPVGSNKKNENYAAYYVLPSVGMISKNNTTDLLATYTFNYQLPKIIDLYEGYILSDVRTFSRGASVYVPESSHLLTMNCRFQNFENYYNAPAYFINTLISRGTGGYQYRYEFENTSQLNQKIRNLFPTNNTLIAGGVEQYIAFLLSTIKFRPTLSWTTYTNSLNNNENRENQSFSSTLNFTMRSGFKHLFNFAWGISPSWNTFRTHSAGAINTFRYNQIGGYLDLYFNFKKEVEFRIENEFFSFQNQQQARQGYIFVNAYAGYSIKKWNTKIGLRMKNIGNSAGLANIFVNDISTITRTLKLLPRYVLLEINFRG